MYRNIINVSCASTAEMFKRLRDFLCARNGSYDYSATGIGWVLHDSFYAVDEHNLSNGDYVVLYSPGEGGADDLYIQLKYSTTSTWLIANVWLYWNATSHSGVLSVGPSESGVLPTGSNYRIWIYGDLSSWSMVTYTGSSYYAATFGRCDDLLRDDTVAVCAAGASSGSDVSMALDSVPASWVVGQRLFIRDNAGASLITIKSISGNTVVADIPVTKAAGCKLSADWSLVASSSTGWSSSVYGMAGHSGNIGQGSSVLLSFFNTIVNSSPDPLNNEVIAARIRLHISTTGQQHGRWRNIVSVKATGRTAEEVLVDVDSGSNYRYFPVFNSINIAFMEV